MTVPQNRTAVGAPSDTYQYDALTCCASCSAHKAWTPTEHVEGRGPGWKCLHCQWWNWIGAAS